MWSDRDWFIKRTQAEDYQRSIEQVVELRIAMDLLLAEEGVDASRFAYVGHDFGAMYGVLAGTVDPRPTAYVLMAGTPRFPNWFLYYPKLGSEDAETFKQSFAPIDPITMVSRLSPAPVLFQFAVRDVHVPTKLAEAFFAAAAEPKEILWYESGHGLNEDAAMDRLDWLAGELCLAD
jgi:dienelactone hydrolase